MKALFKIRKDLGIRALLPSWRALFDKQYLREDVLAGLTVACVAIPLSLAIALASGVDPAVGLVTAILAGIVCALFGGTTLAVRGPASAMAVIVGTVVENHGISGLLIVGLVCGVLQLTSGVFSLGRFVRLVPIPVVEGFTAGIGAIILIGQLPRALGLPPPAESHVIDVLIHIRDLVRQTNLGALFISGLTLALILGLPRLSKKIPAPFVGIVVPTVIVAAFGIDLPTISSIPRSFPAPALPSMPSGASFGALIAAGLLVFSVASLETLLSSSSVDKLVRGERSDPDQELIGQGLGNIVVALFGGIPVTGVIARSAANVQAGAKTRRSAIIHALVLLATVLVAAPLMERIPIAALAGLLLSVALRMLHGAKVIALFRVSRGDALVYVTTFAVIVFVDLLKGVQWGVLAALAIVAIRLGRTHGAVDDTSASGSYRLALHGPVTFLSSLKIETLREEASLLEPGRGVVVDVRGVRSMDSSGAEMVVGLVTLLRERGLRPAIVGANPGVRELLIGADSRGEVKDLLANTESEAASLLDGPLPNDAERLARGVTRFLRDERPRYAELFARLAKGQAPHTLFITCADSRVQPNLITSTDPGELFIVRNVGNMVSPCTHEHAPADGAGVEYAVGVLGVRDVVVCAHSTCGAIRALMTKDPGLDAFPSLTTFVRETHARELCQKLPSSIDHDEAARLNALSQLDHLATYPIVRERVARGELRLHAWFFDIATGEIEVFSPEARRFLPMSGDAHDLPPESQAGIASLPRLSAAGA